MTVTLTDAERKFVAALFARCDERVEDRIRAASTRLLMRGADADRIDAFAADIRQDWAAKKKAIQSDIRAGKLEIR
jgi:hypothetical protein